MSRRIRFPMAGAISRWRPPSNRACGGAPRAPPPGAGLINDVRALREPGALKAAAASGCAVCLVHMQGEPRTMQVAPHYSDVVTEVRAFLEARVAACREAGLSGTRLTVDPGFGFGKTLEHNLTLLRRLRELAA